MNQAELVASLSIKTDIPQTKVKAVLEALAETVQKAVTNGQEISLQGIAKFSSAERAARVGRNPATGEPLQIEAKRVPVIKALKPLKDAAAQ